MNRFYTRKTNIKLLFKFKFTQNVFVFCKAQNWWGGGVLCCRFVFKMICMQYSNLIDLDASSDKWLLRMQKSYGDEFISSYESILCFLFSLFTSAFFFTNIVWICFCIILLNKILTSTFRFFKIINVILA